jgi:hypothetical protein
MKRVIAELERVIADKQVNTVIMAQALDKRLSSECLSF